MTFINAIKTAFQQYFTFSGRANRSEYWYFLLFIILAIPAIGSFFGTRMGLIAALALFIPALTTAVRRLHDIDKPEGWAYLGAIFLLAGSFSLLLTPLLLLGGDGQYAYLLYLGIGLIAALLIAMIYFLSRKGTEGENRYGAPAVDMRQN